MQNQSKRNLLSTLKWKPLYNNNLLLSDVVAFHFVRNVQKMLLTSVQIAIRSLVSLGVHWLSLVEVVVPQELVMTEAMHMARQTVMCPQQKPCQGEMTKKQVRKMRICRLLAFIALTVKCTTGMITISRYIANSNTY